MYRGNMPNQFNGGGIQQGQDYNNPGYNPNSMPNQPGQQNHVQMRQGQVRGHPGEMQHFPNASPRYAPSPAQMQAQYRNPQPGNYPYGYNSNKMMSTSQSYPASISNPTQSGHMYVSTMPGQIRGPGGYSGSGQELPTVSEMRASKVAPTEMGMLQSYGSQPDSSGMYNGQPYMGRMRGSGNSQMAPEQIQPMQGIQHQNLPQQPQGNQSYPGREIEGVSSYSQQHSSVPPQYQQGMAPSSVSSAMYRHPQYPVQSPQTQRVPSRGGQFEESAQQKAMRMQQQQMAQQQSQMSQQSPMTPGSMPGSGGQMKSFMSQQYRGRTPTPSGPQMQNQQQNSQMIGVSGHPLQQAMSPRHNSPLSPMRNVRQNVPPVSPQISNPQYTGPQESPHNVPQPRPMSPSPRMPSYSPKLMQQGQPYMTPGQPGHRQPLTPSRTPTPRSDSRGFMSPPRMMSPPPNSQHNVGMQHSQAQRMQQSPFNGDSLSSQHLQQQQQQQHLGYYGQAGRYPHGAWQGGRQPTPNKVGPSVQMQQSMQAQQQQAAMQKQQRYSTQQQQQMYGGPGMMSQGSNPHTNKAIYQPGLVTPTSIQNQRMMGSENGQISGQPQPPRQMGPMQGPDFGTDFNLDSLLGDPTDSTGSFMQQLQEITPAANNESASIPSAPSAQLSQNSQVLEPGQIPPDLIKPTVSAVPGKPNLPVPQQLPTNTLVSPSSDNAAQNSTVLSSKSENLNESLPSVEKPTLAESNLDSKPTGGDEVPSMTAEQQNSMLDTPPSSEAIIPVSTSPVLSGSSQVATPSSTVVSTTTPVTTTSDSVSNSSAIMSLPTLPLNDTSPAKIAVQTETQNTDTKPPESEPTLLGASMSGPNTSGSFSSQGQVPVQGQTPGQIPVQGPVSGQGQMPSQGQQPGQGQTPGSIPRQMPNPMPGQMPNIAQKPNQGQMQGQLPSQGQMQGQIPVSGQGPIYRPGMGPGMQGHPRSMQMQPNGPPGPGGYHPGPPGQYQLMHSHQMQGMPPQPGQPGVPQGTQVPPGPPTMHPHDGTMIRGAPPGAGHYPQMHAYPPRHMHPQHQYGYGPHPQASATPYPPGSGPRPPYSQARPHMQGAPMRHGYMGPGPRPPYPGQHLHPSQQQHLQQRLQAFRQEAQQLQAQLQRVQHEENQAKEQSDAPPDMQSPPLPSPRMEPLRGRLMEVERNIRHIMSQLQHQGLMQDPNAPNVMALQAPPGFQPHDSVSPGKLGEDPMTPGAKKKRPRKPKTPKASKDDGEEGSKKEKPPKKKKKKDLADGEDGEKKKKKKSKKSDKEKINAPLSADNELSMDGDTKSLSTDMVDEEGSRGSENIFEPDSTIYEEDDSSKEMDIIKKKSPDKKKRKPPATLVKTKKKRKRGYDSSDEMNSTDVLPSTPPALPDESLIEKRRSGRNVKRKRYIEAIEYQFSGDDDDDSDAPVKGEKQKPQQIVEMNNVPDDEEIMIVDKILSHRIRKKKLRKISESKDDKILENGQIADPNNHVPIIDPQNVSMETTLTPVEGAPILSPTSLKNPRIRRLSMGVDKLEEEEEEEQEGVGEDEFFVKYKNYSFLHCEWKLKSEIEDKRFDQKLKRYIGKNSINGQLLYPDIDEDEIFNPDFVEVDRVLDVMHNEDKETGQVTRHFLSKWCSLAYEDSTWEREEDINKTKIFEFEERCQYRPPQKRVSRPHKDTWHRMTEDNTRFKNNNLLRDYQFEGINWLMFNWYNRRNCILADEMGLGKTIQSITFLQKIFDHGIKGPFLIVAPLSTIANWQREFESWTTINAVVYHGSQTSRDMLYTYEWFCRDENLDEIEGSYKMHAVITTYEMIVLDSHHLRDVDWRCLIIDEAHRLKNLSCKLVESLRNMQLEHKVLLTGTPLQNNVEELFALLSFLQPDTFNCQQAFSIEFGNLKDNTQVQKLQELLKPMMLRRLKEDVEKSLAPKQETIIEVELTDMQKKYYRAILERNFEFLAKGTVSGNVPNLMNAMMELRKCCNHPYLIKGAEDKIMTEHKDSFKEFNALTAMIQSSGKLVLIDKLLPRLKEGGHKVLIFSQMVRVLDILEDYLVQKSFLYERIDGCIRGNERQMAIDRFSKKGSDRFVFLLCTRAGGLGINLTAADTVIIFDSDWNPQNDLQAQARCHRIGQQKPVKIYRLITRNSYEREMFDKASLKLGLDKAVLQSISGRQDQITNQSQGPQLSKHEVEDLLKRGAYGAIMDDDDAGSKFCEEDIDQILERRAHTVTLESGEKGSSFSKASFVSTEDRSDISLDDPNFWEKWAKKADLDLERLNDNKLIIEIPRNRKQTRRFGGNPDDNEIFAEIGSDSDDSEYESGDEEGSGRGRKSKFRSRAGGMGGGQRKGWGRRDCFRIEKCLLTFGWGRWGVVQTRGRFSELISEKELEDMSRAVLMYCLRYYNGDEKIKFFMWDLISPTEDAAKAGVDLRNHEGLAAPVPRGRKGKRAKEDTDGQEDEQSRREWARSIDLDSLLPDEGFRKHIQHQCNKVLLRVRMLYYLRTEILGSILPVIENRHETLELDIIDKLSDPPSIWWDQDCDKCLMVGVYKYGYEKYNIIRADPLLCFLERAGPPDERLLAAEMNVEPEDTDADPEYKPTRVTFTEQEFADSPAPGTPSTEPASPSSTDTPKSKKDDNGDLIIETKRVVKPVEMSRDWPSISELNTRLRKLVAYYQKQHKHMQQRLMNLDRRGGRQRYSDGGRLDVRRNIQQARWTRREEADFYRTVSTFGIERDHRTGEFLWQRFRNIARLDRKSDESLRLYYFAFRAMCEKVCRWKGEPGTSDGTGIGLNEEIPNIDVDHITEERASRTLYRIRLLDKIRCEVLSHPKVKERLALCQRSPELPIWWKNGIHDKELLIAMDRHGVTRTEIHTLNDPKLTFLSSMREYDANPTAFKQQIIAEKEAEFEKLVQLMKAEHEEQAAAALKKEDEEKAKKLEEEKLKKIETENKESEVKTVEKEPEVDEPKSKVDEPETQADASEDPKPEVNDPKSPTTDSEPKESAKDSKFPVEIENGKKSPTQMETDSKPVDSENTVTESDPKSSKDDDVVAEIPKVDPEVMGENIVEGKLDQDANKEQETPEVIKEEVEDKTVSSPEKSVDKNEDVEKMDVEESPLIKEEEQKLEVKEEKETSDLKEEIKKSDEVVSENKEEVVETKEVKSENKEETISVKEEKLKEDPNKGMSLRSKHATPPLSQDIFNAITSSFGQFGQMGSPYLLQAMNGRWPKDRILIQRVENICYCILNGEWPSIIQSSTQGGPSAPNTPQSGNYGSRSDTPISFSEGRRTPVNTVPQTTSMTPTPSDINLLGVNDPQLQAAMAQILSSSNPEPLGLKTSSYSGSRRGRRKKRPEQLLPQSGSQNFNNPLNVPMDKSLQRKIEQLMAANNSTFANIPSSTASLFSTQGGSESSQHGEKFTLSSKEKEDSGNSSASLLANLRELAKAESKSEQGSRGRPRSSGSRSRHQHSPSPSQSRSKDQSSKISQDLLKHNAQFMPTPEQLLSMNPALQQAMQDAMKAGIDPMTAAAAFLPLFPMLDPFQMMNQGAMKQESLPQLPPQINLPSPAEMEKLLKSMGLPPELAFSAGLLPAGMMMPPVSSMPSASQSSSSSKSDRRRGASPKSKEEPKSAEKKGEGILGLISDKRSTPQRKGSKLDAMFGGGGAKDDESPGRSSKKSRKSKFVSPAMLPGDTRIPVHNNTEGVRLSGSDAPLNKDLADWLKENTGFVVDYQALRQQLDEAGSKKLSEASDNPTLMDTSGQESDVIVSPRTLVSPKSKEGKSKDEMLEEADILLKNAEKLVQNTKRQQHLDDDFRPSKTPDKSRQPDFALPKPLPSPSPSSNRGSTPHGASILSSKQQQQQLNELAMIQQMNMAGMAGMADPAAAAMFGLPPEILNNLANLPPDVAQLITGGFFPGGISPDLLASLKPPTPRLSEDKSTPEQPSPTRSTTPSRGSPSQRHGRSHNYDKTPPRDHNLLVGDDRVPVINITTGKKLTGKQAPELQTLADYLRIYQDVVIAPEWTNVLKKSKFLPKELHNRLIPSSSQSSTSKSSSSATAAAAASSAAAQSNAALAALSSLPPSMAAAMFPGLMQGQSPFMPDPMQLMAALQQMPGQGQMPDMKALAASGFPMLPLFGAGMPSQLLPPGFGGDPATMAAMAALSSQGAANLPTSTGSSSSSKKSHRSSHERGRESSSSTNAESRGRKSKKYSEKSERPSSTSSGSFKQNQSQNLANDPMMEALAALQRTGGLQGMTNPFLGAGGNPMMFPPMMMGQGGNINNLLQFPMEMMNPELLAAQMAALGSMPGLDPNLLKPPTTQSSSSSSGGSKRDQRRGSTSSSSSTNKKEHHGNSSGNRTGGTDEQPMDLTSFSGGTPAKETPEKHKH